MLTLCEWYIFPDYRPEPAAGSLSTASLCSLLNASQTRIKIRIRSPFFKVR
ncbi:hypothetical protein [Escherichia coli]|uniref:hypothetical protein n=1 Tax=Escherichia coli TaxID=562 RepID=UPI001CCF1F4A|nr:hypothetical protein [Escherichia coli]UBM04276.1 hypothetical protein K9O95_28095 [Escherichia coli]UBM04277.1 hypothetical protein K9O95_28085 [Escherichia coli]